jgi:hypothetical protein
MDSNLSELLQLLALAVGIGAYLLFQLLTRNSTFLRERQGMIGEGIKLVYGAVAELARKTPNEVDDKAALALKKLGELLAAQGSAPLTAGETLKAKLSFDALHVSEKTTETLLTPK